MKVLTHPTAYSFNNGKGGYYEPSFFAVVFFRKNKTKRVARYENARDAFEDNEGALRADCYKKDRFGNYNLVDSHN